MTKEFNIMILQDKLNDGTVSPLKRYFIWELLQKMLHDLQ